MPENVAGSPRTRTARRRTPRSPRPVRGVGDEQRASPRRAMFCWSGRSKPKADLVSPAAALDRVASAAGEERIRNGCCRSSSSEAEVPGIDTKSRAGSNRVNCRPDRSAAPSSTKTWNPSLGSVPASSSSRPAPPVRSSSPASPNRVSSPPAPRMESLPPPALTVFAAPFAADHRVVAFSAEQRVVQRRAVGPVVAFEIEHGLTSGQRAVPPRTVWKHMRSG